MEGSPGPIPVAIEGSYLPAVTTTSYLPGVEPNRREREHRSSATWTTSSGDLGGLSDTDDVQDRLYFVDEYNKLAKKHGIRLLVPEDYDRLTMDQLDEFPHEQKRSWFSRTFRRQVSGTSNASSAKSEKKMHHKRSFSDMAMHIVHVPKRDTLKDADLQSLVRLCGKSFLYLPSEYASGSLVLPTCLRATAQYLVQHGTVTRGIFRIPGSVRVVGALYDYYCADQDPDEISSTIRCPNLPLHIKAGVHDVASTFKRFLAGLPGGILGSLSLFDALVAVHSQLKGQPELHRTKQSKLRARLIALAIGSLRSQFRRELICSVFGLLCLIGRTAEKAPREDQNGHPLPTTDLMGYNALGIVFGPLLVGDLLDSYTMKVASPNTGLMLFPLTPPRVRRERRRSKSRTSEDPMASGLTVDKIHVANSIAEMLITNWRDVVEQMKSLKLSYPGVLRNNHQGGSSYAAHTSPDSWLRPSASEPFVIRKPARWGARNSPSASRGTAESPVPPSPTPAGRVRSSERSSGENAHGGRLHIRRKRPKCGRSLSRNRFSDKQQTLLSPTVEEPPSATRENPAAADPGSELCTGPSTAANFDLEIAKTDRTPDIPPRAERRNRLGPPAGQSPRELQSTMLQSSDRGCQKGHTGESSRSLVGEDNIMQSAKGENNSPQRYTIGGNKGENAMGRRHLKGKSTLSSGNDSMADFQIESLGSPGFKVLRPKKSTVTRVSKGSPGDKLPDSKKYQEKTPTSDERDFAELADGTAEKKSANATLLCSGEARSIPEQLPSGSEAVLRASNPGTPRSLKGDHESTTVVVRSYSPRLVAMGRLSPLENKIDNHSPPYATAKEIDSSRNRNDDQLRYTLEEKSNKLDRSSPNHQTAPDQVVRPMLCPGPDYTPGRRSLPPSERPSRESLTTFTEPRPVSFPTPVSFAHPSGLKSTRSAVKAIAARFENASRSSDPAASLAQSGKSQGVSKTNNVVSHYTTNNSATRTPTKPKRPANSDSILPWSSPAGTPTRDSKFLDGDVTQPRGRWHTQFLQHLTKSTPGKSSPKDVLVGGHPHGSQASDDTILQLRAKDRTAENHIPAVLKKDDTPMQLGGKKDLQPPESSEIRDSPVQGKEDTIRIPNLSRMTIPCQDDILTNQPAESPQTRSAKAVKGAKSQGTGSDRTPEVLQLEFSPGQTGNSGLHTQIRKLQRQLDAQAEETSYLRRQLETRESTDVGTLNEQLRLARAESQMWRERAEAAERRVATYERFAANLRQLKEKERSENGSGGKPMDLLMQMKQEGGGPCAGLMDGQQENQQWAATLKESPTRETEGDRQVAGRTREALQVMDGADSGSEAGLEQELLDELRAIKARDQTDAAVQMWMAAQEAIEYEEMEMAACWVSGQPGGEE